MLIIKGVIKQPKLIKQSFKDFVLFLIRYFIKPYKGINAQRIKSNLKAIDAPIDKNER